MRTTIVFGILLLSLACIAPPVAAEGGATAEPLGTVTSQTGCPVVDPYAMPPVRLEPCHET